MPTIATLLREAKELLATAPFAPSGRESHLLLGHVLGLSEARLLARDGEAVPPEAEGAFRELLARRLTGEPVAYLVRQREFYGRPFRVDRRVLIPRPETEHLVEAVLALDLPEDARVLDVGTGSGAIALTLALERPGWRVVGTDLSPAALAVAKENARCLGAGPDGPPGPRLVAADLVAALRLEAFDLLVSNPPYIARQEAATLSPEVRDFEPPGALFDPLPGRAPSGPPSGTPGTRIASLLLERSATLPSGAPVVLEIGDGQLDAVRSAAARHGRRVADVVPDYAGVPRVVVLARDPT